MKAKVKLIKKEDRNGTPPAVEPVVTADPKDWSTAVKSWVTEFQKDRQTESLEAFDSLFTDPTS
jgi:hypothetical protein